LVRLASKLNTGKDAINILIDSERVAQWLNSAFRR
jgi:hypothetical protein